MHTSAEVWGQRCQAWGNPKPQGSNDQHTTAAHERLHTYAAAAPLDSPAAIASTSGMKTARLLGSGLARHRANTCVAQNPVATTAANLCLLL